MTTISKSKARERAATAATAANSDNYKTVSSKRRRRRRRSSWLTLFWLCHFAVSFLILYWGGTTTSTTTTRIQQNNQHDNHHTKYIPINVHALSQEVGVEAEERIATNTNNCSKGFVNVFALSMDDPGAWVCCRSGGGEGGLLLSSSSSSLEDGICNPPHWLFFVSRRLARFPEAWLLPLFPLFVRLAFQALQRSYQQQQLQQASPTASHNITAAQQQQHQQQQSIFTRRRFYLYVGLIQFRGWILYLLFDKVEEWMVASTRMGRKDCWYEHLLHDNYQSCQGQGMDFSDHVVLYFAQILPIALVEVLHSLVVDPFWKTDSNKNKITSSSLTLTAARTVRKEMLTPIFLVSGMLYLYIVTFMGAYKTAVYFHTWPEILRGYLVSMLVQVPLFLLQCTTLGDSTREYFFG